MSESRMKITAAPKKEQRARKKNTKHTFEIVLEGTQNHQISISTLLYRLILPWPLHFLTHSIILALPLRFFFAVFICTYLLLNIGLFWEESNQCRMKIKRVEGEDKEDRKDIFVKVIKWKLRTFSLRISE